MPNSGISQLAVTVCGCRSLRFQCSCVVLSVIALACRSQRQDDEITRNVEMGWVFHVALAGVPATFDNATKLLSVNSQHHVGALTYGTAAIGQQAPRTVSSFLPEFDAHIAGQTLTVEEFANRLGQFFLDKWTTGGMPVNLPEQQDMFFYVGGYDAGAPYGRLFQLHVPHAPQAQELFANPGEFGAAWGGQREVTDRLLVGFDPAIPNLVQDLLAIPANNRRANFEQELKQRLITPIPWQFLPLQDCVDLSIFVVRTTIALQRWLVGVRGVGGAVDVATITRTEGYRAIQVKVIEGERRRTE